MNAKDQLDLLRDYIFEATASHWSDLNLLRRINIAQGKWAMRVAMQSPEWLLKSAAVTPVASVITLPTDCSKPIYLEETSGRPISWLDGGVKFRRITRSIGTTLSVTGSREAYPLAKTIEVNEDSFTTACTLWYIQRVPDLNCGTAKSSSGANALELDDNASTGTGRALVLLDDYYNGVTVEVIDNTSGIVDIRSTISDYAASTHIATITGTPAENDTYGTISILPEEIHRLLVLEAAATALMKPSAKLDKDVLQYYLAELRDERKLAEEWLASRAPSADGIALGDLY